MNSQIYAKNRIFEKSPKQSFLAQKFFNKGQEIFLDKNHQKFAKAIRIHVSRECFLTCLINFLFSKILAICDPKN